MIRGKILFYSRATRFKKGSQRNDHVDFIIVFSSICLSSCLFCKFWTNKVIVKFNFKISCLYQWCNILAHCKVCVFGLCGKDTSPPNRWKYKFQKCTLTGNTAKVCFSLKHNIHNDPQRKSHGVFVINGRKDKKQVLDKNYLAPTFASIVKCWNISIECFTKCVFLEAQSPPRRTSFLSRTLPPTF